MPVAMRVMREGFDGLRQKQISRKAAKAAKKPPRPQIIPVIPSARATPAARVETFASGLNLLHGLAFRGGDLYVAENHRMVVFRNAGSSSLASRQIGFGR
jgi:glucose/arabinose dehydrogenase